MSTPIADIGFKLGLDGNEFERGVKQSMRNLGKFAASARGTFFGLTSFIDVKFRTVAKGVGILSSVLMQGVISSAAFTEQLRKSARTIGVTTDALAKMQRTAMHAGVGMSALEDTFRKLSDQRAFTEFADSLDIGGVAGGARTIQERFQAVTGALAGTTNMDEAYRAATRLTGSAQQAVDLIEYSNSLKELSGSWEQLGLRAGQLDFASKVMSKFSAILFTLQAQLAVVFTRYEKEITFLLKWLQDTLPSVLGKAIKALVLFVKHWKLFLIALVGIKLANIWSMIKFFQMLITPILPALGLSVKGVTIAFAAMNVAAGVVLGTIGLLVAAIGGFIYLLRDLPNVMERNRRQMEAGLGNMGIIMKRQLIMDPDDAKAQRLINEALAKGGERMAATVSKEVYAALAKAGKKIPELIEQYRHQEGLLAPGEDTPEQRALREKARREEMFLKSPLGQYLERHKAGTKLQQLQSQFELSQKALAHPGITDQQRASILEQQQHMQRQIGQATDPFFKLREELSKGTALQQLQGEEAALQGLVEKGGLDPTQLEAAREKLEQIRRSIESTAEQFNRANTLAGKLGETVVNRLGQGIGKLVGDLATGVQKFRDIGTAARDLAKTILSEIVTALATALAKAIAIKLVLGFTTGGFAGFGKGASFGKIFSGSLSKSLGFQEGGIVGKDWQRPGPQDTIPAWLARGEAVLPSRAVAQLGEPAVRGMQRGMMPGGGTSVNVSLSVNPGWVANPEELGEVVVEQLEGSLRGRLLDAVAEATTDRTFGSQPLREASRA